MAKTSPLTAFQGQGNYGMSTFFTHIPVSRMKNVEAVNQIIAIVRAPIERHFCKILKT